MLQMSPMNWSIIMVTMSCLILMTTFMNCTLMNYQNTKKNNVNSTKLYWK